MSEVSSKDTLLPCPFCGGKTQLDHPIHPGMQPVTFVLCDNCGACVSFRPNLIGRKVIDAWNKRVSKDAERLNSNTILIHGRDEFGEPTSCIHTGLDLRVAIDAALEQRS